jgi:Flp pilus assembly protein TadD
VVLADGSPPPKPVAIERICEGVAGSAHPEGVTDAKGHFRFEVGRLADPTPDASIQNQGGPALTNPGAVPVCERHRPGRESMDTDTQTCALRAVLDGYYPELIDISGTGGPIRDVGTIILRPKLTPQELKGRGAAEERAKSVKASTPAKELTEAEETLAKVRQALKENKTPEAQRELEHLVELQPGNASTWYELGLIYEQQGRRAEASKSYTSAISADATLVGPYAMLAGLQARDQQWKELAETTEKLIRVNPVDVPAAYFYKTVAHYNLADLDEAEKAARQGIQIDPQRRVPRLHHLLGNILADDRNFAEAAEQMKLYIQYTPDAKDRDDAQKLANEWTKLASDAPADGKPQ